MIYYVLLPKRDDHGALDTTLPFFYLAGPVRGGGDWQAHMCQILNNVVGECIIAVPCRWEKTHPLKRAFIGNIDPRYKKQTEWEQFFIEKALTRPRSCVICWLEEESQTHPRTDGGPYGRDTYGELGYFRGLMEGVSSFFRHTFPLVLGGSEAFPGLSVIKCNFNYTYGSDFPFATSMEEVATRARGFVLK